MRRIISQDPTGPMPDSDSAGQIILVSKRSDTFNTTLLIGGLGVFSIILWCIYFLDPQVHAHNPGLLVLAIMWSVFLIVLPFAIVSLIRGPASLVIDQTGIAWVRNGRRTKQMVWSDMREIQLTPTYTTGRGQPLIGADRFVTTQIKITGTKVPVFRLPNFGIAPVKLASYVLEQQHKMASDAPAILRMTV